MKDEPIKVLVVEDDFMVAQVNRDFVEKVPGFCVVGVASSGAQALEMLEKERPDLVILDIYLPDMSGTEVLRCIRASGNGADVIVITAAREAGAVREALQGGAIDYIIKSFRFERFAATLEGYKAYRDRLQRAGELGQREVDRLYNLVVKRDPPDALPKGIDHQTLDRVRRHLERSPDSLTAEEVAHGTGLSRTTARRYLDYLVETGQAKEELTYGAVGRPEHRFTLRS